MDIPGKYKPGALNSITDVPDVLVGHETIINGSICTGVTVISPCKGDIFLKPIPAAAAVGNGFGKMTGTPQIEELGTIESLIGLTNTLSVPSVWQGLLDYHIPNLPEGYTINIVVGETNDGQLNDIHGCHITPIHVKKAIENLSKNVTEGNVGAGAGTVCFGFKGGIGTASRLVEIGSDETKTEYSVGALVQSNYGGSLTVYGKPISKPKNTKQNDGSCMIVVLTDAPLSDRQLKRVAKRGLIGMTNTGSYMGNGSGDFCIAASNFEKNRPVRPTDNVSIIGQEYYFLSDFEINPIFEAAAEAVQEALYNSLTMATAMENKNKVYPSLADVL